ncbi:MAG: flagellar motor protein [Polycyclovorans sp.]|jgi:chemotaxis protein MotA|nr:flagellar motor protein [Polycyclovorans sp.]MDP1543339.1 flagellar motor protein [Polycyclovorans sp.]|tara:strand:+ start:2308 stop:3048 length:741 start_codon:yes stop_codon:yes gene_type:complete
MDIVSLAAIVLATVSVIGGSILKGAGVKALLSSAAFMIVVLGTIASVCLHTPASTLKRAMAIAKWVFMPPKSDPHQTIEQIVEWSNTARKQGLLALEASVDAQPDEFIKKGLQMLVDGAEPETLRATLEVEIGAKEHHDLAAAKVFESAGIYAPTLGIIGAVMGLMAVMQNLADPSKLGAGIAAAFVATIYGIGFANLFLLPMANKLKAIIQARSRDQEMLVEGLVSIARGENPRNIEARLSGYLH